MVYCGRLWRSLISLLWIVAFVVRCADPSEETPNEPEPSTEPTQTREPEPAPKADVEQEPTPTEPEPEPTVNEPDEPRKVQALGTHLGAGRSQNGERSISGQIAPPGSWGRAESTQYKVRSIMGAPRTR